MAEILRDLRALAACLAGLESTLEPAVFGSIAARQAAMLAPAMQKATLSMEQIAEAT